MTKIKNTKKGMAKKTLSMSLVVAMLATSNVPVWAAEFSDGTDAAVTSEAEAPVADTADAFTDDAETEAPVADTTADAEAATAVSESKTDIKLSQTGWTNPVEANGTFYDKDGDKVFNFYYTWYVDGLAQTSAPVETKDGSIEPYHPTSADVGKNVTLRIYSDKDNSAWTPALGNDSWVYESDPVTVTAVDLNREQKKGYAWLVYAPAGDSHMVTYNGKNQSPNLDLVTLDFWAESSVKDDLKASDFDITSTLKEGNGTDADSVFTITATPKDKKLYSGSLNYDYKIQAKYADPGEFTASMAKDDITYEYTGNVVTPAISDVKATALSSTAVIKAVAADNQNAAKFGAGTTHKANVVLDSAPNYVTESVRNQGVLTTSNTYRIVKRNLANVNIRIGNIAYDGKVLTFNDPRFEGNIHFFDKTTGEELKLVMGTDYDVQVLGAPTAGTKAYDLEITAVDTKTQQEKYNNTTGFQKMSYNLGNETFKHEGYTLTEDAKAYLETAVNYTGKERVIDKSKVVFKKATGEKLSPENYEIVVQGVDAGDKAGTVIIKGLLSYGDCEEIYHFDINAVKATAETVKKVSYVKGYTEASQYAPKTTVTATVDGKEVTLEEGKDYTISYKFNTTNMIDGIIITNVQITNPNYMGAMTDKSAFENYTRISKRDLSKCTVTVEPKSYTYTGAVVKPTLKVMDGEEPLTEGVDYKIAGYKNAKDVGTATVTLQGIGDNANPADGIYDNTTTLSATYEITAANAADIKVEFAGGNTGTTYTGNVIKPTIYKVTLNGNDVSKQFDFVYPSTNVNVGTGHVILKPVVGNKNFTGQKDAEFKINARELEGTLKVYDEKGNPYTVGTDGYLRDAKGKVYFAVDGKPHTFAKAVFTPTGKYAKYVTENDYEIVYVDNTYGKADVTYGDQEEGYGIAHIAVIGKGNFTGTQKVTDSTGAVYTTVKGADYKFYIQKYEILKQHVTIADGEYAAGQPVRPNVTVTVGGKTLVENQDYKLTYSAISDLTNGKTMKVTVHGINGYKGEITGTWGVVKKNVANTQVVLDKAQYKKGEKPSVTVYNSGVKVADTEYTVSYTDDNVTVTANKDSKYYTGSQTVKVIRESETETTLGTPVITGVNATGNKTTAVLGGESANASGYDYVISTSKDPSDKDARIDVVKNQVQTTANFKYVPQGTYYAYCHAWTRDENGKKVFGEWSNSYAFSVTAITPDTPEILSVKTKGSTITVTYKESANSTGYDVVLGKGSKKEHGETRPYQYGNYKKLNVKPGVCKAVFKNVPAGTYYVGVHSWNRTASENNNKVFSKWSKLETAKVK